jgi:superfamily II DNA or RNA helicase/diadenosine tetraphosphate (Ap4A) HIT family hydrolase/HKD family nuclease
MSDSPFLNPRAELVFYETELVRGIWDGFPVSPGHALIVPRRLVASWFEATLNEQTAILKGIEAAKTAIEERHSPQGYNIGINVGAAGGQTVFHLHVHVIPRYEGDVEDPRGGVRHVIPNKANYLVKNSGASLTSEAYEAPPGKLFSQQVLDQLSEDLDQAREINFAVAFLLRSGWKRIAGRLWDLLVQRQGKAIILTGDYLDVTDPDALQNLLDLSEVPEVGGRLKAFVFGATKAKLSFHPKAYLFISSVGTEVAYIGSSNLSEPALTSGMEWNYRLPQIPLDVRRAFQGLVSHQATAPLTQEWLDDYRGRRRAPSTPQPIEVATEPPSLPPEPNPIQREALEALGKTREGGNGAGLVVLATGLGKTWLAAFDSVNFQRVLFVAHREEILSQAHSTFRIIRPTAKLGFFTGKAKDLKSEVLFASVQTLSKHYKAFSPTAFDYIVVDEFHHASAASYRSILDHFTPAFLLGLTATPERTDGGDLLGLCGENVVYRCELAQGIRQGLLCPFHYFGVPDGVDYTNIPWRNRKFDIEALTAAVATRERAENVWEQYQKRGGHRTVAFCCSQRHADFMASFFKAKGKRAVAVHTGPESAHRSESLESLKEGNLDILFSVDMFNEGLDLPKVDTVMMLRPTLSRVLWLQQLGRGLRKVEGKDHLVVIDYIGNHRTFLVKLQTLFLELAGLMRGGDTELRVAIDQLQNGELTLPEGCEVTYDLEVIDILKGMLRTAKAEALTLWLSDFRTRHGRRPAASEAFHEGYNPRAVDKVYGSWFDFLRQKGALSEEETAALEAHRQFLNQIGATKMEKSYKMLLLQAMLSKGDISRPIPLGELTDAFITRARRSSQLAADVSEDLDNVAGVQRLLLKHPVAVWAEGKGTGGVSYFQLKDGVFASTVKTAYAEQLTDMVRELVDWRLADYLDRPQADPDGMTCKVSQTGGRPILFLPDRARVPSLPTGEHEITIDGEKYRATFAKIAINVIKQGDAKANVLPSLMRGWFGPDAGMPGTLHQVQLVQDLGGWTMAPVNPVSSQSPIVGHRYAREQIPPLFGLKFRPSTWNSGVIREGGVCVLLVTKEKDTLLPTHQYVDRFLSADRFQWQSQNRTTQASSMGQLFRHHAEQGAEIQLFVRATKKEAGVSQPFLYCGSVDFESWTGDQPITIVWRLKEPLDVKLIGQFGSDHDL